MIMVYYTNYLYDVISEVAFRNVSRIFVDRILYMIYNLLRCPIMKDNNVLSDRKP